MVISWNPLGHNGAVTGLLYLYFYTYFVKSDEEFDEHTRVPNRTSRIKKSLKYLREDSVDKSCTVSYKASNLASHRTARIYLCNESRTRNYNFKFVLDYCIHEFLRVQEKNDRSLSQALRIISTLICGNKMPTECNRGFYCRSYCLFNMFGAPLCPSSGAQSYYTVVVVGGISCCGFQVAGLVWS